MKKLSILILTSLCLASLPLAAQSYKSTPVTVSQEKVSKEGKTYLAHTVLDHQTLFSISRAYGVSYQEIVDANPEVDLTRGQIQTGQILLIPRKDAAPVTSGTVATASEAPAVTETEKPVAEDYTVYVPKWYETLDMVAAKFNVGKDVLMAYNGFTTEELAKRQPIRIPARPETVEVAPVPAAAVETASEEPAPETTETVEERNEDSFSLWDLFRTKKNPDKISLGVVLPFNAKGQISHSAFDLYSGMLLAVRDLDKTGIRTDIHVIDNKNAATPLPASSLDGCDLIIGPIAPEDLETVLDLCPRSTVVVSPLDPKAVSLAGSHANFIQAPSPADAQNEDVVEWVREECQSGDKILLISEKDQPQTVLAQYLAASGLAYETLALTPGEARDCAEQIRASALARSTARILISSEKETFFNDVIRNLNLLVFQGQDLILYGPAKIRTYDMVEVENLHQVQAHLSCSYYIDYDNPRMKDFLLSYRALFGAEPTQFAYQGYDAAWYFIRNFSTGERDRERTTRMEDRKYRGLQSDFLIVGNVNRAVRRVVYGKDYTIRMLNQ